MIVNKQLPNFGVSVCISCYKNKEYIKECLDSIVNQSYFKFRPYEILLGIDGDNADLMYVKTIMKDYENLRVFMMKENYGTYITSNTMMNMGKFHYLLRFDADDVMTPDYVRNLIAYSQDCDIMRGITQNFGRSKVRSVAYGSILIKRSIFKKFGGYRPWICSADAELLNRLKRFVKIISIKHAVYNRRIHTTNLTVDPKTNNKSKIRKRYSSFINRQVVRTKYDAVIKMITGNFEEITNENTGGK